MFRIFLIVAMLMGVAVASADAKHAKHYHVKNFQDNWNVSY